MVGSIIDIIKVIFTFIGWKIKTTQADSMLPKAICKNYKSKKLKPIDIRAQNNSQPYAGQNV